VVDALIEEALSRPNAIRLGISLALISERRFPFFIIQARLTLIPAIIIRTINSTEIVITQGFCITTQIL
jgi:hypothetical protein